MTNYVYADLSNSPDFAARAFARAEKIGGVKLGVPVRDDSPTPRGRLYVFTAESGGK